MHYDYCYIGFFPLYRVYWKYVSWYVCAFLTIGVIVMGICAASVYLSKGGRGSSKDYPLMYTQEISVSNIFCQDLKLEFTDENSDEGSHNVSVYMLDSPPTLTGRKQSYMQDDTFPFIYKVNGFDNFSSSIVSNDHIYPGSTINVSACLNADLTSVSIFVFVGEFIPSDTHLDLNNPTDRLTTPCRKGRETFFYRVTSNNTFNVIFVTFCGRLL